MSSLVSSSHSHVAATETLSAKLPATAEFPELPISPLWDSCARGHAQARCCSDTNSRADTSFDSPARAASVDRAFLHSVRKDRQASNTAESRIEMLIMQQNFLMQQQLELSEKQHVQRDMHYLRCRNPTEFLKSVDSCMRRVFVKWRNQFRTKVSAYVSQSRKCKKYQREAADAKLMKPFLAEARRTWRWTECYRAVAKPIHEVDPTPTVDAVQVGVDLDSDSPCQHAMKPYDVDAALAALRHGHARELQSFVIAHEKACLEKMAEEISLARQVQILEQEVAAVAIDLHGQAPLEKETTAFVEIVHREEMIKAQGKIREDLEHNIVAQQIFGVACGVPFLAAAFMGFECSMRVFVALFGVAFGMAFMWEDLAPSCLHFIFGTNLQRWAAISDQSKRSLKFVIMIMRRHLSSLRDY